jgi:hypothetical protein
LRIDVSLLIHLNKIILVWFSLMSVYIDFMSSSKN